jgi:hypothetical protein
MVASWALASAAEDHDRAAAQRVGQRTPLPSGDPEPAFAAAKDVATVEGLA